MQWSIQSLFKRQKPLE